MRLLLALAVSVALVGCGAPGTPAPTTGRVEVNVFAAASLRGALEAAVDAYAAEAPGVAIRLTADSSAVLRTQIEQGAPADLYLSADTANPARLVDAGLAEGTTTFAANELAVIVPMDNRAGLASPADLALPGIKIIAAGDQVPITGYAMELVANLAREAGYPPDFAAAYAANVVSREDNVSAVVAKLELGEGDAGIVYRTDALASEGTTALELPAGANVSATYDGVVVSASARREAAAAFLAWLAGAAGQGVLAGFGFLPVP